MENNIEDLKKRVDHLQYDEIKPLKEEINDMKVNLGNNDLLTKQAVESVKNFETIMESFKDTLIDIAQSVKESNRINGEITKTIEEMNNRITSVEKNTNERFNKIDERAKIDWQIFVKNNWLGIIMGVGALIYAIGQIIE